MSSIIESTNGSPKRRQTIFDFSAKETKQMNDEVKCAMKKMPLKKAKIRIDIPEINQDHSNIVYGMVAVFSGLVFWILPALYTRFALPYLFEELAPLYEST
jgi:hypothetical protein